MNQLAAVAAVLTVALLSSQAAAVEVSRGQEGAAVASCQGALPAFEGAIRKRLLSVQNEGATGAFVTCAFLMHEEPSLMRLWVNTVSGSDTTITCTGVTGYQTGTNVYSVKSVIASASGGQAPIAFTPADFEFEETLGSTHVSVSCNLPPGAGINDSYIAYSEPVGE